jgi:hypothetical protein
MARPKDYTYSFTVLVRRRPTCLEDCRRRNFPEPVFVLLFCGLSHEPASHTTQGVPEGKVNILRDHSIRHYKHSKVYMYVCPTSNGFRDRAISLYSSKIVDKKEILRTVSNTGIYCSSDKVRIINNFFNSHSGGVQSILGPLGTSATEWPIVPARVI